LEWVESMHGKNIHTTYLWLWSWDKEKKNWDSKKEGGKTHNTSKRDEGVRREGKIENLENKAIRKRKFWEVFTSLDSWTSVSLLGLRVNKRWKVLLLQVLNCPFWCIDQHLCRICLWNQSFCGSICKKIFISFCCLKWW